MPSDSSPAAAPHIPRRPRRVNNQEDLGAAWAAYKAYLVVLSETGYSPWIQTFRRANIRSSR